jgi:hypothetical protein
LKYIYEKLFVPYVLLNSLYNPFDENKKEIECHLFDELLQKYIKEQSFFEIKKD